MAKRTKKQKLLADHRHLQYHLEAPSNHGKAESEKKFKFELLESETKPKTQAPALDFIASDLRKTALITFSIVLAQIVLFIVLNRM
jgi:hypothetical protein